VTRWKYYKYCPVAVGCSGPFEDTNLKTIDASQVSTGHGQKSTKARSDGLEDIIRFICRIGVL